MESVDKAHSVLSLDIALEEKSVLEGINNIV
jgi:hypothetical protein